MEISKSHKKSKKVEYWNDLSMGSTTNYKAKKIEELIRNFFPLKCSSILDIGSGGNCDHILKYRDILQAERIACLDYDEKIINQMRQQFPNEQIEWYVADIFKLQDFKKRFDLVFLLDVLHEVYSFYGRPSKNEDEFIDNKKGLEYITRVIENISKIVNSRGGVIITDSILPNQNKVVTIKAKTKLVESTVRYFFENYPTRKFKEFSIKGDKIILTPPDLIVLLTQYNKIKKGDWDRWKVERLEQHEYMTKKQYEEMFKKLGFKTHFIIETPDYVKKEWNKDFEIISGLDDFPSKRVTLLALKE